MHYGHPKHTPSPEDLTIIKCRCGWHSEELSRDQMADRGVPWYCDDCGNRAQFFVTFHPRERERAYEAIGIMGSTLK